LAYVLPKFGTLRATPPRPGLIGASPENGPNQISRIIGNLRYSVHKYIDNTTLDPLKYYNLNKMFSYRRKTALQGAL